MAAGDNLDSNLNANDAVCDETTFLTGPKRLHCG